MKLDIFQRKFITSSAQNVRLLAPAGSGKTLSLLWRCRHLSEVYDDKAQRFLIFTFTRVARDQLKERLDTDNEFRELRKRVRIDTLNRWGYNYLRKQVESSLALKTRNDELFSIVKHNLRPVWTKNSKINHALAGNQKKYVDLMKVIDALKTSGFRHDTTDLIGGFVRHWGWLKENGLLRYFEANIENVLQEMGLLKDGAASVADKMAPFLKFWKKACNHLWDSAIITLDDQKYWTLLKLQEKYSDSKFPEPNRYHHIMVDEFQDINPLDLCLIQELVLVNSSSLTIVGDDDQAIYEWRGATPRFILNPDEFFGVKFETCTLGTNYRSPSNILLHSQKLISHNINRVPKNVKSVVDASAEIVHRRFNSHDQATDYIVELARSAAGEGHPRSLAVLARKKCQLIPLQIILTSKEIPFYAKEDLNVLLSDAFADLKRILEALATKQDRRNANDIVSSFLSCCNKVQTYPLPKANSKRLYAYLMSQRPRTFMKCIEDFQSYTGPLRARRKEDAILEYALPIARVMETKTVTEAIEEIKEQMAGLRKHYAKGEDDIFYKDPPFLYLAEYATRYGDNFLDFIDHVEGAIASMASSAASYGDEVDDDLRHSVHLMTSFRAKGKEFDTVVILDANDGMWPIRRAVTEQELEQERRVFYVAVTRPRKRLIIVSTDALLGRPMSITPYIAEMGLDHIIEGASTDEES